MNLYSLDSEYLKLLTLLDDNDGEITEEIGVLMEKNAQLAEGALKNYTSMYRNLESNVDAIEAEIKRLSGLKKAKERSSQVVKDALTYTMKLRELDKYDGGTFKLSFRKSVALIIDDESKVPGNFLRTVTSVDKMAVKDAIKDNPNCEWAHLQENENIQIK